MNSQVESSAPINRHTEAHKASNYSTGRDYSDPHGNQGYHREKKQTTDDEECDYHRSGPAMQGDAGPEHLHGHEHQQAIGGHDDSWRQDDSWRRDQGWRKPFAGFGQSGQQSQQAIEQPQQQEQQGQQANHQHHSQQAIEQPFQGNQGRQQDLDRQSEQPGLNTGSVQHQHHEHPQHQHQQQQQYPQHQHEHQQQPQRDYIVEEPESQQLGQMNLGQRPQEYHKSTEEFSQSGTNMPPEHSEVAQKYVQSSDPREQPMSEQKYVHDPPQEETHIRSVAPASERQDPKQYDSRRHSMEQPVRGARQGQQAGGDLESQQQRGNQGQQEYAGDAGGHQQGTQGMQSQRPHDELPPSGIDQHGQQYGRNEQYPSDRSAGQYSGDQRGEQYSGDRSASQYSGGNNTGPDSGDRTASQYSGDRSLSQGSQEQGLGSTPSGGGPLSSGPVDRTLPGQQYPEQGQSTGATGTTGAGTGEAVHDPEQPHAAGGLASWIPFTQAWTDAAAAKQHDQTATPQAE